MPRRTKQNYVNREDFHDALIECESGVPTVKVCTIFRLLITRYLSGPRYYWYDVHTKEDLASAALVKCLKNLRNYKPERGSPFSYFTLCCECACKDHLRKQYEQENIKRDLMGAMMGRDDGAR